MLRHAGAISTSRATQRQDLGPRFRPDTRTQLSSIKIKLETLMVALGSLRFRGVQVQTWCSEDLIRGHLRVLGFGIQGFRQGLHKHIASKSPAPIQTLKRLDPDTLKRLGVWQCFSALNASDPVLAMFGLAGRPMLSAAFRLRPGEPEGSRYTRDSKRSAELSISFGVVWRCLFQYYRSHLKPKVVTCCLENHEVVSQTWVCETYDQRDPVMLLSRI